MKQHPLIMFTLLFISGIVIQRLFDFSAFFLIILIICSFSISFFLVHYQKSYSTITVAVLIISTSSLYYHLSVASIKPYPFIQGKIENSRVFGTVDEVYLNRSFEFKALVHVDSLIKDNRCVKLDHYFICRFRDTSLARLEKLYSVIAPGNGLIIGGTMTKARGVRNPGEFDYQKYNETKGISAVFTVYSIDDVIIRNHTRYEFSYLIFSIKKKLYGDLLRLHDYKTASLMKGLILADRSDISRDIEADFINAGVIHVLAVSGLHVVYIMMIFVFLTGRMNIYVHYIFIIVGLVLYMLITGMLPSVARAVLMASILFISYMTNRSNNAFNIISLSALILLIVDPKQLFDAGFQLSYAAVLSIILLYPFFKKHVSMMNIRIKIIESSLLFILITIAAQLGTLPFTLFYYGKLSLISLVANVVIVPLSGVLIFAGLFILLAAQVSISAASFFAGTNIILTKLFYNVTHLFSSVRYSFLNVREFDIVDALIFYSVLILLFILYDNFQNIKSKLLLILLSAAGVFILISFNDRDLLPKGYLTLIAVDVAQGDAMLISMPDGTTLLIDAGETTNYFDNGESVIMPLMDRLGVGKINYGFISHIDADHYSGFTSLIHSNKIEKIIKPKPDTSNPADTKFERFLENNGVPVNYYKDSIICCGNTRIYMIGQQEGIGYKDNNDRSGIIKIVYGNTSFLFTGDISSSAEKNLITRFGPFLRSKVLKVSHHGSKKGTSGDFLRNVSPQIAVISAGEYNRFSHPAPEVLNRLSLAGSDIYRTDQEGAVILKSDGKKIEKILWRASY